MTWLAHPLVVVESATRVVECVSLKLLLGFPAAAISLKPWAMERPTFKGYYCALNSSFLATHERILNVPLSLLKRDMLYKVRGVIT